MIEIYYAEEKHTHFNRNTDRSRFFLLWEKHYSTPETGNSYLAKHFNAQFNKKGQNFHTLSLTK